MSDWDPIKVIEEEREKKRLAEEQAKPKEEPKIVKEAEPKKETEGWFSSLKSKVYRAFSASQDVINIDDKPDDKDEALEKTNVTGNSVIYKVPDTMKTLRVRVLESNGRLKNQYALTKYIDIKPGDKIHIIVDE